MDTNYKPSKETAISSIKSVLQHIKVNNAIDAAIKKRDSSDESPKEPSEILNMGELLKYLKPYKITRSTVDKWIMQTKRKRNDFPFHKKGKRLYFYESEIETWLRSNR